MRLFEIATDLNWADQTDAERPNNFSDDDYVLLNVNIEDVFNHSDVDFRLDINSPTGGKNAIGDRLNRAKSHFKGGGAMDPPEVAYSRYSNGVEFTNGRHRAVAAYQLGHEYIPMFVAKADISAFTEIVKTK